MDTKYCQSCAMPMGDTDALYGTEKDGSKSKDYCHYCYANGAFTYEGSIEGMIDICIPPMVQNNPGMSEKAARSLMTGFLPTLKRWKQG
ncbi:MAG: zinc ribbon domain-containing protein [Candidatus Limiplasma sp.]|nr:zinc ribbon domain-containing protein [Candidatus Limiplasma sp.]MEA5146107.1 zinc ribbon domain-containing protein [Candidatus Limiplasma sp.]